MLVHQRKNFLSRGRKKWRLLTYSLTHFGHLHFALYIDGENRQVKSGKGKEKTGRDFARRWQRVGKYFASRWQVDGKD